jgi:diguanylate cyclase
VLGLARAEPHFRRTLTVLTIGLTLIAAAGGAYVFLLARHVYLFDTSLGLGWPAGLVLIGIAALDCPSDAPEPSHHSTASTQASLWLPYIPLAIAGGLELAEFRASLESDPALGAAPWLIIAVLGRQFLVVAENRRLLHSVSDRALRDPLTDLANRVLFHDRLDHAIQLYHRDRRSVAVLSMDLDDFKLINDNLGHAAGDALLVQAGQRLTSCVRTGDTVARLGGDEFAVLIEDAGENAHLVVYQIMEAFERPFSTDDEVIFMRPSAGLTVASLDDPELSADGLLKQADMAMYSAKRLGGGLQTFSPDMHVGDDDTCGSFSTSDIQSPRGGLVEVRLLSDLRQAISHRALTVLYQPKVDLQTGRVVGAEALVRWPHPVFGLVQPHQFLPLVRQHGLMRSFTDLILDQALGDAARWRRRGIAIPVAVNLFPPLVGDVHLPARIFEALARHQLPGDSLIIEITEDLLLDNIDRTRQVLEALRESNIHVALDDFGSGYSALTYLRKLPIDEVKVDYDLISHVLTDSRAEAIVRAVIDLAHALDVATVAEGVENAEIADWLRDRGCEIAQGMLYSPPITAPAMMELLVLPASN